MEQTDIAMIGATGHLQSVMDSAQRMGCYRIASIVDDYAPVGKDYFGHPVAGSTRLLEGLYADGVRHAFVSAGTIGGYGHREEWYLLAQKIGFRIVNIVDPTAAVSAHARIGEGVFIGKNAVVNAYAQLGNMVIVNTGSIVEHADVIEDFVHIAPGCTLSGGVRVCRGAHIGTGSAVRQDVVIGREAIVGVGSVVLRDVAPRMVAYGNPCRERRPVD